MSEAVAAAWDRLLAGRAGAERPAPPSTADPDSAALIEIYADFAMAGADGLAIGHLGQSLDGRIALDSGASHYVTGEANIVHLHRMRALADAVLVGAETVLADDPRLTVRRVPGPNPVRVVLDPRGRVPRDRRVFTDGAAETLVLDGAPSEVRAQLRARGLVRLFVEGGGVTVSRFLADGALDRLHVCVAPMILGSGRPAFSLPAIDALSQALRPPCRRIAMDPDLLYVFDLSGGVTPSAATRARRDGPP